MDILKIRCSLHSTISILCSSLVPVGAVAVVLPRSKKQRFQRIGFFLISYAVYFQVSQWLVSNSFDNNIVAAFLAHGVTGNDLLQMESMALRVLDIATDQKGRLKKKIKDLRLREEKERKAIEKELRMQEKRQLKAQKQEEKRAWRV